MKAARQQLHRKLLVIERRGAAAPIEPRPVPQFPAVREACALYLATALVSRHKRRAVVAPVEVVRQLAALHWIASMSVWADGHTAMGWIDLKAVHAAGLLEWREAAAAPAVLFAEAVFDAAIGQTAA